MYDVIIVGAGPAGATLARLVGPRNKTLLVERRPARPLALGAGESKCCGGLLAPDAQCALAALGLGAPRDVLVGPQLFAVRSIDLSSRLERHYQRSYVNVDRGRFDAWLRSLVPPEVEVRSGTRFVGLREEDGEIAVELEGAGGIAIERARLVVGADGAASGVRRCALPGASEPVTYLAVQEWFEARRTDPCYTAVFDPGVTDFYGWVIPKADRVLVGAALRPGPEALERFKRLVQALADVGIRFGRSLGREGTMLYRPRRSSHISLGTRGVALVGEAAGFVSPSSAEGVSSALRSADALAAALAPGIDGWAARYRAQTARLRRSILLKNLKAPVLFTPVIRRAMLASGIGSIDVGEPPTLAHGEIAGAPLP